MTQSCWLSSEPLLVLSRVDLLFAGNAETNVSVFQAIENNYLVSMSTFVYSLTTGKLKNWYSLHSMQGHSTGPQVQVLAGVIVLCSWTNNIILTVPSQPKSKPNKMQQLQALRWTMASHQGFIHFLHQKFRNTIFWNNVELKNLWLK